MRDRQSGFFLLLSMATFAGLMMLTMVGLSRSMTELLATNQLISTTRAFHVAEAGIDEALAEFSAGGPDQKRGNFSMTGDGNDQWQVLEPCEKGACRTKDISIAGGTATIAVLDIEGALPTIRVEGRTSQATRTVTAIIAPHNGFVPIIGAVALVDETEEPPGIKVDKSPWEISGHDAGWDQPDCGGSPQSSLPAVTTTTDEALERFRQVGMHNGNAKRLTGAPGDFFWSPSDELSIHSAEHEPNVPTPQDVLEFIEQACQYADYSIDDGDAEDASKSVKTLKLKGGKKGMPAQLGTPGNPAITCLTNPNKKMKVELSSVSGAGILIANSDVTIKPSKGDFAYDGVIITYGPHARLDFRATGEIRGAVIIAATGEIPEPADFAITKKKTHAIEYCSCCIEHAKDLFVDRGGNAFPQADIKLWQSD